MENITSSPNTTFVFRQDIWLSNAVIGGICLLISVYILMSLSYFEIKYKKKREKFSFLSTEKKFSILSRAACITIGVFSLVRQIVSLWLLGLEKMEYIAYQNGILLEENMSQLSCDILGRMGIVSILIAAGFVYSFLWLRQRIFYVHPSLKGLNGRIMRVISYGILFFLTIFLGGLIISYLAATQYQFYSESGCLVDSSASSGYIIIAWIVVSTLIQLGLLILFIHPILRRKSWQNKSISQKSVLLKRVKKAIILAVICLITDILTPVIILVSYKPNQNDIFVIYNINLVVNHLATIFCFDQWRNMLWPWRLSHRKKSITAANITESQPSQGTAFTKV